MPTLNPVERRALATATVLIAVATAVRVGLVPAPARTGWSPTPTGEGGAPTALAVRAAVSEGLEREARASRPLAAGETIDPNFADATELRRLPGIGPARADAIVRERSENGPFLDLQDFSRVRGIGEATLERLAPRLSLPRRLSPAGTGDARPLDLNRAGAGELAALPGIGPVIADRIVAERRRRGGFHTVEELLEVPGIGPATLEKVRGGLRVR